MEKVFKSEFKAGNFHKLIFEFFSSYLFCIILLVLIMLLVFLGTLAQTEMGLFETQEMFFNSLFFMYPIGGFSLPLPGVYLLLALLFVNVVCGGIIRLKYSKRTLGIFIIHAGVIYLLIAGLVSFHFSTHGFVRVKEGDTQDYYESWNEWDIQVSHYKAEDAPKSWRIPLVDAIVDELFTPAGITVQLKSFTKNASLVTSLGEQSIEGFAIKVEKEDKDISRNVPAARVKVNDREIILWGNEAKPFVIIKDGEEWQVSLNRRRYKLPFELTLKKFSMEMHPNTQQPKSFESLVQVNGKNETLIQMNEPLRHEGTAMFQSSYEKNDIGGRVHFVSVFSTVVNPSDQWPLYACILLGIGLLVHFCPMLFKFLKAEAKEEQS